MSSECRHSFGSDVEAIEQEAPQGHREVGHPIANDEPVLQTIETSTDRETASTSLAVYAWIKSAPCVENTPGVVLRSADPSLVSGGSE